MSAYQELRKAAQEATGDLLHPSQTRFRALANPQAVLKMLDRLERAEGLLQRLYESEGMDKRGVYDFLAERESL